MAVCENNTSYRSTGKRKSLLLPNEILNSSLTQVDTNDDDSERLIKQHHEDIQKRLSSINQTPSPLPNDFKSHFDACVKLFTENKINAKNAWCLKIIDIINVATNTHNDPLQIGSTSLDVSTKVYSVRVDDVYTDGIKLASNIARSEKNSEENEHGCVLDDDNEVCNEDDKSMKKTRKKRAFKCTTTKSSCLCAPLPKLESVFFQTHVNPELSVIENLCTLKIPMDASGHKFMLLSDEKMWPSNSEIANETQKKVKMEMIPLVNEKICPMFNNFTIDEWDRDEEQNFNNTVKTDCISDSTLNNITQAVLDKSIPDMFDECLDTNNSVDNDIQFSEISNRVQKMVPILNNDIDDPPNYSRQIDLVWAGPSHWKLKCIKPAKPVFTGQGNKTVISRNRKKVTAEKINFDDSYPHLNYKTKVKQRRPIITESKLLLPFNTNIEKLATKNKELMSKPGVYIVAQKDIDESDDEIGQYDYNNPNDSLYCSLNNSRKFDQDHDDDDDDLHDKDTNEDLVHQENFIGHNLIELPEMVAKSSIPYAMHAKKMDMQKLKSVMWKCMKSDQKSNNTETKSMDQSVTFSKIYNELPFKLNKNMKEALTCPLAFVALLHLANENNLKITKQSNTSDLVISLQKT